MTFLVKLFRFLLQKLFGKSALPPAKPCVAPFFPTLQLDDDFKNFPNPAWSQHDEGPVGTVKLVPPETGHPHPVSVQPSPQNASPGNWFNTWYLRECPAIDPTADFLVCIRARHVSPYPASPFAGSFLGLLDPETRSFIAIESTRSAPGWCLSWFNGEKLRYHPVRGPQVDTAWHTFSLGRAGNQIYFEMDGKRWLQVPTDDAVPERCLWAAVGALEEKSQLRPEVRFDLMSLRLP